MSVLKTQEANELSFRFPFVRTGLLESCRVDRSVAKGSDSPPEIGTTVERRLGHRTSTRGSIRKPNQTNIPAIRLSTWCNICLN